MTHQSASFTVDPQYHINSVAELEGGGGRGEAGKFRMLLFLCGSMVGKRIGIYVVSSIDSRRVKLRLLRDGANKSPCASRRRNNKSEIRSRKGVPNGWPFYKFSDIAFFTCNSQRIDGRTVSSHKKIFQASIQVNAYPRMLPHPDHKNIDALTPSYMLPWGIQCIS